jgi:hypothetical protein
MGEDCSDNRAKAPLVPMAHCGRWEHEPKQSKGTLGALCPLDCFVAALLAMTIPSKRDKFYLAPFASLSAAAPGSNCSRARRA